MYKSIISGLLLLIATVTIIIFAYYTTIVIGKKTNKLLDGRYTQVLERTIIGLNTNITILKINQKIYIVTMQGKTIQLLDIIDEKDWKDLNDKDKIQLNKGYTNDGFLANRLFNKIKKGFSNKRYSWNGSDNDEK